MQEDGFKLNCSTMMRQNDAKDDRMMDDKNHGMTVSLSFSQTHSLTNSLTHSLTHSLTN